MPTTLKNSSTSEVESDKIAAEEGLTREAIQPSLPAYRSAEQIFSHPGFLAARDAFVDGVLALYEHDPSIDRMLLEAGRATLFIVIMCLHARCDDADPATWPTVRRVVDMTLTQGLASRRRLNNLMSQFIGTGYLTLRRVPQDGRVRLVTPTEKMIGHDQDWLVAHYRPLQQLFPEASYARIMERDPAFQFAQRLASSFLALGAQILSDHPIAVQFLDREAGVMILMRLLQLAGREGARGTISYSEISARFGVSRTHVRNLLQDAEKQGLVTLSKGEGQLVQLSATLVDAFDKFLAAGMSGHDLIYQLAMRRVY